MKYPIITQCPVCYNSLYAVKLECGHCRTRIENTFELSTLAQLSPEQLQFAITFLVNRGNIKEVEKELGISYPTVRGKLNDIITALGYDTRKKSEVDEKKVISMLENGEITADEAVKMLKHE
ncbi:DUF2089 domain-containing protein [Paenibacillus sp. OV219]|uniref:DUF2089 domain-containing protein n=1 Tax=Paenibacillus sp. OV219 TaxID=1884377 RepID=UPI0008D6A198|nr:DUF2089 domain-containing protein [Paenibacillus sp. OV219]SEN97443.1 hypothetical protein SAMN05518847_105125 [Paenibacillus sp. OV219]